jgi:mercuric ion transport protein
LNEITMDNLSPPPVTRAADKAGVLGAIISAIGCAACFPGLGSLGAALGLGFLSQYEGRFIRILLPLFAMIVLGANVISWRRHRNTLRGVLSVMGPLLVLAAVLIMRGPGMRTGFLLYPGLVLMITVAIWDLVARPARSDKDNSSKRPHCC